MSMVLAAPGLAGVYGPKLDVRSVTAEDMLSVYSVNCVGPLLVVQGLLNAGLIGGFGGKSLVANVSSKVSSALSNVPSNVSSVVLLVQSNHCQAGSVAVADRVRKDRIRGVFATRRHVRSQQEWHCLPI
jgi:hypothetical protein